MTSYCWTSSLKPKDVHFKEKLFLTVNGKGKADGVGHTCRTLTCPQRCRLRHRKMWKLPCRVHHDVIEHLQ